MNIPRRSCRGMQSMLSIGVLMGFLAGCTHTIKVEPIKVEPIDITLRIYLEADEKLDAFFGDMETSAAESPESTSASLGNMGGSK